MQAEIRAAIQQLRYSVKLQDRALAAADRPRPRRRLAMEASADMDRVGAAVAREFGLTDNGRVPATSQELHGVSPLQFHSATIR